MEGIKYLKLFEDFKGIDSLCEEYRIGNYTINDEGTVDVDGDVDLSYKRLPNIPIKFGIVSGSFGCCSNGLTSLEGCPKEIGGDFECTDNKLKSLEFCSKKVGISFYCSKNHLSSLEGCPKEVGDNFKCSNNRLTSLEGSPEKISGYFRCDENKLKSLEGSPKEIDDVFNCSDNKLTSLKGCPNRVGGNFSCISNKLKIIDYLPERIDGYIDFRYNEIRDIKVEDKNYRFFDKCNLRVNPINVLFKYWNGDLKSFILDLEIEDFIRYKGKSLDITRFEYALNGKEYEVGDIKINYNLIYKK